MKAAGVLPLGVAVAFVTLGSGCNEDYVSHVSIYNDTSIPVIFHDCTDHCSNPRPVPTHERDRDVWNPGEHGGEFAVSGVGAPTKMQVFDARDGRLLGCFYIVVPHGPLDGLVARVSQRQSCKQHIDEDTQWPPGGHHP